MLLLRPLQQTDFSDLFAVAADPAIWEQHPDRERYKRENFSKFFDLGIASAGALAIIEQISGRILGSSRFYPFDQDVSSIEIGYTFLARDCWGQGHNRELKTLMLDYAFRYVSQVYFKAWTLNLRSRRAIEKLGATLVRIEPRPSLSGEAQQQYNAVCQISKALWDKRGAHND
jgi:RimJ/RimL family protein N-acetyltransferase